MENFKNNQSTQNKIDQLIRYYQISVGSKKEEVLDTILNKIEEGETRGNKLVRKISWYSVAGISAAASVAIIIAFYFYTATITLSGVGSENLAYMLPDNSRIILQEKSEIKYKKYYWNRKVKLQGEAYFEVIKGNKFRVMTNLGEVEVLGTRFLVSEVNENMTVTCFEGKVKASINKNSEVLNPGTKFTGNKSEIKTDALMQNVDYPEFAKFNKTYSKAGLEEITKVLETFFGKEILVKIDSKRKFSGTIQTGKMESALDIVCGSLELNYQFVDKNRILITN
ncbi:MAG: FecR family protein [Bacteroidota bacterium]